MNRFLKIVLFALNGFVTSSALAIPVQWTLQNMTFSNGSIATGSFVFDRDTNAFSNILISLSAGTGFQAQTFDAIAPSSGNHFYAIFTTLPFWYNDTVACDLNFNDTSCGTHAFGVILSPSQMTNGGGTIAAQLSWLGHCGSVLCNSGSWSITQDRSLTTGSIVAVPEPETYAMMLASLGLVGWVARRKLNA